MVKEKFASINGLRAISIALVISQHLNLKHEIFKPFAGNTWADAIIFFLTDGSLGVNVFFVISGFLITSLMLQEESKTNRVSLRNFYIRRTLRIFPAYYFLLLVYFILQSVGYLYISDMSWLTAITYTKYFNWKLDWYTGHAWSLSVEEHFYLLWPMLFVFAKKYRLTTAVSICLLTPLVRVLIYFHPVPWINEMTIFWRIDAIALGCLVALKKDDILRWLSTRWTLAFWGSVVILFVWHSFFQVNLDYNLHLGFLYAPLGVGTGTMANLMISVIMMYSIFGPKRQWYRFLNFRVINYIGLLSYSLYLWQQLFISGRKDAVSSFPQNLLFVILAALGSYYLVEKPFLRLKDKF